MSAAQIPIVLSAISNGSSIGEAVQFLLAGFTVVMATLLTLAVITAVVGWIFRQFPVLAGPAKAPVLKATARTAAGQIDGPLMAAIGSAVDQALGGRYRICSVKSVGKK